jgi:predicted dehydrogenase
MSARIDGADGSIEVEHIVLGSRNGLHFFATKRGGQTQAVEVPGATDNFMAPFLSASAGARHFVDAIRDGFEPRPGFDAGLAVQQVLDAALHSHREQRWTAVG